MSMAAKDLCVATTHPAEQSPRTNDVDRTPVDASYSGVGFAILARTLEALTSRSRPLVTFST
jgi:hypothetical protein